jgi:hypothetical protein
MTDKFFSEALPPLKWVEVHPDGGATVEKGTLDATSLRNRLGGTPEQTQSPWDATVFIRSDSHAAQPVNWLATMLLRQSLSPGQQVRGVMVVLGQVDDSGEVTAASDALVDEVLASVAANRAAPE